MHILSIKYTNILIIHKKNKYTLSVPTNVTAVCCVCIQCYTFCAKYVTSATKKNLRTQMQKYHSEKKCCKSNT